MSEQIVEVLDNDRRERREGTSRTGNIVVIGHKGSGKTVLAVDIVKAIQKQRNLKQGKVAIVTGESLNKKELGGIVQKLRGGAIIIEKAAAKEYRLPMVNVVPKLKAGGSFATAVYAALQAPVAVEAIQAHAGIDIGDTLIGMHLRPVAVPVRIGTKQIGEAHVVCARTRLKFIGGERASYLDNEK